MHSISFLFVFRVKSLLQLAKSELYDCFLGSLLAKKGKLTAGSSSSIR